MPHILLKNDKPLKTPYQANGVSFDFIAKSKNEDKIAVTYKNKRFLLTKKRKDGNFLIKADKITRVTPVQIVKDAINSYAKATASEILFSNTQTTDEKAKPEEKYLKDINFFIDDFKAENEIWIEVGFGSGRHLLHQAKKYPHIQFIGLEIHTPSIEQMLKHVKLQNITNILALNYDARLFLEFIDSNSVSKIFVHFPVPWDKKPHRRVYSKDFINESLRVLKQNGTLELRTDSRKYFDYSLELLTQLDKGHITIDINKDLEISSKYEERWKKQNKNIYDVLLYCNETSEEKIIDNNFKFSDTIDYKKAKTNISKKPIVKDNFIIHFESIYDINETSGLIQLTFGSFNRPVSKYILIQNGTAQYFQGNPIPTGANGQAHKLINEILKDD